MPETEESPASSVNGDVEAQEFTVSLLAANIYGTLFGLLPGLLFLALFYFTWRGRDVQAPPEGFGIFQTLLVLFAGIVVHELLHGLGWMVFAGVPRSNIKIGVKWKVLTPFAHSSARMPIRGYRWGGFLPGLVLGILPSLLAIAIGSVGLIGFGFFFTITAGGDFLLLWLLRHVPGHAEVADHPSEMGAVVYV